MDSHEPEGTPADGTAEVGHAAPHLAVVTVRGEHDLSTEPLLSAALDAGAANSSVLVDLSHCEFMDSTIIAALLRAGRKVQAGGERFALLIPAAHSQVRRIAEITQVAQLLPIYSSRDEALAALEQGTPPEAEA